MNDLSVVVDGTSNLDGIRAQLKQAFAVSFFAPDQIEDIQPRSNVLFDIDVPASPHIPRIKAWLAKRPKGGKVVFAVERASWHARAQAAAFGASKIMDRPICGKALMNALLGDFDCLTDNKSPPLLRSFPTVAPTLDALENIFLSAHFGAPLDQGLITLAGKALICSIAETGITSWVKIVRTHHSQTYQHSLLVTGIIVAFAQKLRMSAADQLRLSSAAMLHDIGKARIPINILEKPGKLDRDEMNVMSKHPEYGLEALAPVVGVDKDILDMVVHHHEYLDGTGYPHGLRAGEISDLVRIVTICDIFGALIERRSYKEAASCKVAYDILIGLGSRLDADMRREFGFVSALHVN
jgi:putative nucleotidyltransferase with HDIG domain